MAMLLSLAWRGERAPAAVPSRATMADAVGLGGLRRLSDGVNAAARPSPLPGNRLVTYYGTPRTPSMGVLGQYPPEVLADQLDARAEDFRALETDANILPALDLVYAVAQPQDGGDASNLRYVDNRTVGQYLDLARRRGYLLILDIQIGRSDPLAEVRKIDRWLGEPDVAVALDPEFALGGDGRPGDAVGTINASQINAVQWYLAAFAAVRGLPRKVLVVHQFQDEMIADAASIEARGGVDLIVNMDGYGPADIKQVKYERYGGAPYARFGGIKIFPQHDVDPLTPRQLMDLTPRPSLFMYQ